MLSVDHYEVIRRKVRDGFSQREAAEQLGHGRNTVAKALKYPIPPGYRLSQPRAKPVIEPFTGLLDQWIEDNKKLRPKQRQKAKKMYQRLCDEYGFTGHYTTVQRYVKQAQNRRQEVYMPLAFEPGQEAQVDWHDGYIIENGVERQANFFCMKLCYSKAPFVYPYERANMESFLDGHVRAFEFFGGVPRRIAYDNLKTAVTRVLTGKKRKLNRRFCELRSWYVFDTRFCNVARGNEKGDVENLAKHSEQWFLSPPPQVGDLEELAAKLLEDCRKELDRLAPAPHSSRTRRELLQEEQPCLYELPPRRFEACQGQSTFVDKQLLVRYDTNRYSAPLEYAYQSCQIKAYVDRIELYCRNEWVATHPRCYDRDQFILDFRHYIRLLETKPGTLDNARPFKGQPWGEAFDFMRRELEYRHGDGEGTKRYINILLLFTDYPVEDVKEAVQKCVQCRAFNDETVSSYLRNNGQIDWLHPALTNQGNGKRSLQPYQALVVEGVE
jgi:transposase